MTKVKPKIQSRKTKPKVKRHKNGQIIKGSSRLPNSGRPVGSKSTGKKLKSAKRIQTTKRVNTKKTAGSAVNPNESVAKRHTSNSKRKKSQDGVLRNSKGQLQKGSAGLPGAGRHTGNSKADRLEAIIAEVSAEPKKKEWLKALIRRSYKSDTLAIALLGRVYPALKAIELRQVEYDDDDKKEAADIRKEIAKRFETVPQELADLRKENDKLRYEVGLKNANQMRMATIDKEN